MEVRSCSKYQVAVDGTILGVGTGSSSSASFFAILAFFLAGCLTSPSSSSSPSTSDRVLLEEVAALALGAALGLGAALAFGAALALGAGLGAGWDCEAGWADALRVRGGIAEQMEEARCSSRFVRVRPAQVPPISFPVPAHTYCEKVKVAARCPLGHVTQLGHFRI